MQTQTKTPINHLPCVPTRRAALGLMTAVIGSWLLPSKPAKAAWWASEWTQIANNFELVAQYYQQVESYAKQLQQWQLQVNEYSATIRNIQNLPASMVDTLMGPYNTVMQSNQNFLNSVNGLKQTVTSFDNNYKSKLSAAGTRGISGAEYMAMNAKLAREQGGEYKKQMDQDIAQVNELKTRLQSVKNTAVKIPGLQGNVEALALLNTQTNMMLTNLEEMRGVMLRESTTKAAENTNTSNSKALIADRERIRLQKAKEANERNLNGVVTTVTNPFSQ